MACFHNALYRPQADCSASPVNTSSGYFMTNVQPSYVLPTRRTYVFCVDMRTAIISLYNINWLVFIRETAYCAVRSTIPRSAHTVYLCVAEQTAIISLYGII